MKADLLFVTCICPWPIRGGEYIRSYNTILALSRNFRVVALAPKPALECEALARVEEWVDLGRLGTEVERLQYKIFPHPEIVRVLRDAWIRFKPQVVWFDCGHWGNYALALRRYRPRMIMGTHNFQSDLRRQQVAGARDTLANGPNCRFFSWQRGCMKRRSSDFLTRSSAYPTLIGKSTRESPVRANARWCPISWTKPPMERPLSQNGNRP
jgi:hypothetical protein